MLQPRQTRTTIDVPIAARGQTRNFSSLNCHVPREIEGLELSGESCNAEIEMCQ